MLSRAVARSLRVRPYIRSVHVAYRPLLPSRSYATPSTPKPPSYQPPKQSSLNRHDTGITQAAHAAARDASKKSGSASPDDNLAAHSPPPTTDPSTRRQQAQDAQPSQPLPDLTHGIPSTLDAELRQQSERAGPTSLKISEETGAGGRKGELPKEAYISSLERRRERLARLIWSFVLGGLTGAIVWNGRNWASEEEERKHPNAPSGWGFLLFYNRVRARLSDTMNYYNEPAFPKLLPDPDPAWARPYTLVISLENLLVHGEWSREHGWRMAKRPGVDYFLRYLSSYYELVIWTDSPSMIAQPILMKLDPYRVVMWPLFREATRYKDGAYIKDLSYLNRDPAKTIILDTDAAHTQQQPENAIVIPPWRGTTGTKDLVSLIPFLEYAATMNFGDLRDVLKSFEGKNIPQEYARREQMWRERQQKAFAENKRPRRSMGFMSAIAGPSPTQMVGPDGKPLPSLSEAMAEGKTYQDVVRERGQKQYEMLEKEIQENGEKWLKEMAEEEKKMNDEAMQGMKQSMFGWVLPSKGNDKDVSGGSGKGGGGAEGGVKS